MDTSDKNKRLQFLKKAALHVQDICQEEARFLMCMYQKSPGKDEEENNICPHCFQFRLPGSFRMRLKPKNKLNPRVQSVLKREAAHKSLSLKHVKILQKYRNSTGQMLVTCYNCNKMSRHSGVTRDFLSTFSNPHTPSNVLKRRSGVSTPHSSGKGTSCNFVSKGKSPASTPRLAKSASSTPSPSTKSGSAKKFPFSHLKMLLNLEEKQKSKIGGLQDFLSSL
ncbi:UPF0711 protein C18orf21 homolog [Polypterus senegalus]|uniref:UPF0711 protein C18orf21 homolog n=1 Tax=Polypterus senegalus TaxID=55291 RepID=UPI001962F36F|nr:UPF0711 protein C18orf21 homolog [Polypterus senegalus]